MELPEWRPRKNHEQYLQSAVELTRVLVENRHSFVESHYRELLKICLWKYTEAEGPSKHKTRYRSQGAIENPSAKLNHDHVVTRKQIIDSIIAEPKNFVTHLLTAVGCTVLASEHATLNQIGRDFPALSGWARYEQAGIQVWDLRDKVRVV
jgi:hypothetical protein